MDSPPWSGSASPWWEVRYALGSSVFPDVFLAYSFENGASGQQAGQHRPWPPPWAQVAAVRAWRRRSLLALEVGGGARTVDLGLGGGDLALGPWKTWVVEI
jgi:hypothetical protein